MIPPRRSITDRLREQYPITGVSVHGTHPGQLDKWVKAVEKASAVRGNTIYHQVQGIPQVLSDPVWQAGGTSMDSDEVEVMANQGFNPLMPYLGRSTLGKYGKPPHPYQSSATRAPSGSWDIDLTHHDLWT
tara:strand:+ start:87 stop:479 length:393 start_codon:yes stop_codon:yes gene_type:complete